MNFNINKNDYLISSKQLLIVKSIFEFSGFLITAFFAIIMYYYAKTLNEGIFLVLGILILLVLYSVVIIHYANSGYLNKRYVEMKLKKRIINRSITVSNFDLSLVRTKTVRIFNIEFQLYVVDTVEKIKMQEINGNSIILFYNLSETLTEQIPFIIGKLYYSLQITTNKNLIKNVHDILKLDLLIENVLEEAASQRFNK